MDPRVGDMLEAGGELMAELQRARAELTEARAALAWTRKQRDANRGYPEAQAELNMLRARLAAVAGLVTDWTSFGEMQLRFGSRNAGLVAKRCARELADILSATELPNGSGPGNERHGSPGPGVLTEHSASAPTQESGVPGVPPGAAPPEGGREVRIRCEYYADEHGSQCDRQAVWGKIGYYTCDEHKPPPTVIEPTPIRYATEEQAPAPDAPPAVGECPRCLGERVVPMHSYGTVPTDTTRYPTTMTCPACHGTGRSNTRTETTGSAAERTVWR